MKLKTVFAAAATSLLVAGVVVAQPFGGGPGMMGGGHGMGMGPAVMGCGMGPGMMGGRADDGYAGLELSGEQRKQIADIQETASKAMWQLMGTMHEQGYAMHGMFAPGTDEATARKAYDAMAASRKAMFETQLEARRKIDAVLTAEQRDQLRRIWGAR
jgi:Spy/CpxP family protein refolding chaperone